MASILKQPFVAGFIALGLLFPVAFTPVGAQTSVPAPSKDPSTVVVKGDGFTVTEGDLAAAAGDPTLGAGEMSSSQSRDVLINYMIDLKAAAAAASREKLDQGAEFAEKMQYVKNKLLATEYLDAEVKKAVTDEAMKKLYDDFLKEFKPEDEIRARHILVPTEEDAKKVEARLKAGEDFAKVADEVSKDETMKGKGGDLGFFTKDRMVKPFAEAAFKLEPGQISAPVKTDFGWHIIKIEEKRTRPAPSFDEMKNQIEVFLTRQKQQEIVLSLREKAKAERLDLPAKDESKAGTDPATEKKPAEKK